MLWKWNTVAISEVQGNSTPIKVLSTFHHWHIAAENEIYPEYIQQYTVGL